MCRTVPARVTRVDGLIGWIQDVEGERAISLSAVEGIAPGDYVLHHAGLALERVDPDEAELIIQVYAEMERLLDGVDPPSGSQDA